MPDPFADMNEASFRTDVLIPLLRAMGYHDVEHYHGRDELGKDIVAWRQDDDGSRENVAVVAKVGSINASATGDAATVATQVRQALGSTYTDPTTGEEQSAHRVIVATTGSIRDAARRAIQTQFDPATRRAVRFWSGDKVRELLAEYLPPPTLPGALAQVQSHLGGVESFDIETTTTRAGTVFRASATTDAPVATLRLSFPSTPEGEKVAREVQRFYNEGGSLTITRDYIESFDPHDELRSLFGTSAPPWIRVEQAPAEQAIPIVLRVSGAEAPAVTDLSLRAWRAGAKQASFRTAEADAIRIDLTLRRDGSVTFRLHAEPGGQPVHRARQVTALWNALASGAGLDIRHARTNQLLLQTAVVPGIEPTSPALLELLDTLADFESRFGVAFVLPDRPDNALLSSVLDLRGALDSGVVHQPFSTFTFDASPRQAEDVLRLFEPDSATPITLSYPDASLALLGQTLRLGSLTRYLGPITLREQERQALEASLASGAETHPVVLHPAADDAETTDYLLEYLPADARATYDEDFKGLHAHIDRHA